LNNIRRTSSFISLLSNSIHGKNDKATYTSDGVLQLSLIKKLLNNSSQIRIRRRVTFDIFYSILHGELSQDDQASGGRPLLLQSVIKQSKSSISILFAICEKIKNMDVNKVIRSLNLWKLSLLEIRHSLPVEETKEISQGKKFQISMILDVMNESIILFGYHAIPNSKIYNTEDLAEQKIISSDSKSNLQCLYDDLCFKLLSILEVTSYDPLDCLLTYSDLSELQQATSFSPRQVISSALNYPHRFIEFKGDGERQIHSGMQDSCSLFQLLQKYPGRYINCAELFNDFSSTVGSNGISTQKRFFFTIEEFKLCGLIRIYNSQPATYEKMAMVWTIV